ncbi:MAG: hypothetical protein GY865_13155 [candidate division Zixibacteria bacterium]|nr:hypothetical protein [candidate division Zixibacteria bacterium]
MVLLAIIDFCFPRNAYAYLDPGTGSYLFQMLLAALLGGLFALKIFWRRIVDFFRKLFKN